MAMTFEKAQEKLIKFEDEFTSNLTPKQIKIFEKIICLETVMSFETLTPQGLEERDRTLKSLARLIHSK